MDKFARLVLLHLSDNWNIFSSDAQFDMDMLILELVMVFSVDERKLRASVNKFLREQGVHDDDAQIIPFAVPSTSNA